MIVDTKKRLTKNQKRRQKKKENKKEGALLNKEKVEKIVTQEEKKAENTDTQTPAEDDSNYVYDSAFEKVKDQYKELQEVFQNFAAKEAAQIETVAASTDASAAGADGSQHPDTAESLMKGDEAPGEKKMSKKARKLASRLTVAELKQLVRRPDVVEVEDVTASDPRLLVYLKSYRNTVPVPRHWCSKRHYLQGRRGTEKPPFKLPDYIADTGIAEVRASITEEEREKSLQSQARDRMHPKLHRMDISYDVLESAFFQHMRKPKMTGFGEVYYEGKEYEVRLTDRKPGQLSDRLREALGMTPTSPPPWLWMQQRYGPPPSYPNLRIPGLNSPIPPGCQYGNHAEGWGRPPVDEQGRPLYGDVFGVYVEEKATKKLNPEEEKLWGEIPENALDEEEEEEEQAPEPEEPMQEEPAQEDVPVQSEVVPGSETPAAVQLRKEAGDETPYEPKSLYTHLEEVEVTGGKGFMPTTKKYIIPGKEQCCVC
ncbi:hypothetical protein BLSTO_03949 [Blastocystis sp. subtype 1]